jgi:hypothetical protein
VLGELTWQPQVSTGLSGAKLIRGDAPTGPAVVFKLHSQAHMARLRIGHHYLQLARDCGETRLTYPHTTADGANIHLHDGIVWELLPWRHGTAQATPWQTQHIAAAMRCLAEVHCMWQAEAVQQSVPAVARRLRILTQWQSDPPPQVRANATAWDVVHRVVPHVLIEAEQLSCQSLRCQPVLVDCRAEHFLWHGDVVGAIIDCSGVAIDHPAVDLARCLQEACGRDHAALSTAVAAYSYHTTTDSDVSVGFVLWLLETGLITAMARWCRVLALQPPDQVPTATARLHDLLALWHCTQS